MSNLIKSVYFNVQSQNTRAIDSNDRIKELLPQLQQMEEPSFRPISLGVETIENTEGMEVYAAEDDASSYEDGFSEEEAKQEASRYIEEAKQEAEEIIKQAEQVAETLKMQAYEEGKDAGYSEGMANALGKMKEKEQELADKEAKMKEEYQHQLDSLEPAFVTIVTSLIQKLTGILVEDKNDILLYLIDQAIKQLEKPKSILLRISKEDMVLVMSHIKELKASVADGVEFDVVEEQTLEKNQCIIETDDKMFDCSLDAQIQNLTEQLKLLSYS